MTSYQQGHVNRQVSSLGTLDNEFAL